MPSLAFTLPSCCSLKPGGAALDLSDTLPPKQNSTSVFVQDTGTLLTCLPVVGDSWDALVLSTLIPCI
ncbi:hypothetical protein SRHO_G00315720 [Serrasalmus rhombeus]